MKKNAYERRAEKEEESLSDVELFVKFRDTKDQQAFLAIYKRFCRPLSIYISRLPYISPNDIEDILQSAFTNVVRNAHQFNPSKNLQAWMYTITGNSAIDHYRRMKRHQMPSLEEIRKKSPDDDMDFFWVDEGQEQPDQIAIKREEERVLRLHVNEMGEAHRNVINLIIFQHRKYTEAAEMLRVPIGTIKSRLHEAIRKLTSLHQTA